MVPSVLYYIGPYSVRLIDESSYQVAHLLSGSFAPFCSSEEGAELLPPLALCLRLTDGEAQLDELPLSDETSLPGESLQTIDFDWDEARCRITFRGEGAHTIQIQPRDSRFTYRLQSRQQFCEASLRLPAGASAEEVHFVVNNYLMLLYAFATAPMGMLLTHASAVVYEGKSYLFLGKSGTGKSTHSRLWLHHIPGCYLLNDDNPLVQVEDGVLTAFGSPWSGKTPCYRQESHPLGGFVRLEQAPVNEIRQLTGVEALAALLPSCSLLRPDDVVLKGVMATLSQLIRQVPVYHLRCLPDEAAARLSHQVLTH